MAYTLATFWQSQKIPFFNTEAYYNRSSSKLSQMLLATVNKINVPRTIFSLSFDALINAAEDALNYPYILKDAQASRGQSNYLITERKDAEAVKFQHKESHPFLAQQFVNAGKTDYRFFVAGNKVRLILKRTARGNSHITNTSAGATAELLPAGFLGDEIKQIVEQCSDFLHREVTGVDIIIDKSTKLPYFLEANPIPQIATGSNVKEKLIALAGALAEAAEGMEN